MPARRGNGPGHGGPAKGTSSRPAFTRDNQPTPERKSAGWDVAAEIRDQIAARRGEILAAQFKRALEVSHPQGHAAAADLLNRVMPPIERREITGAVGSYIVAPSEAEDAEAWAKAHKPR